MICHVNVNLGTKETGKTRYTVDKEFETPEEFFEYMSNASFEDAHIDFWAETDGTAHIDIH